LAIWYQGEIEIGCGLPRVQEEMQNHAAHYACVVRLMPGITSVEIVEQGNDFVTIETNEGLMKRTNISKHLDGERVAVEFDEQYKTGRLVTVASHILDEFTPSDAGVRHRVVISDVEATGLLGFFYRRFGKSRMGGAFLQAHKTYLERDLLGRDQ